MAGEELTMPYTDVLQEVAVREEIMILILNDIDNDIDIDIDIDISKTR